MPLHNKAKALTKSSRVYLRKLEESDAQEYYLEWLNDAEVQKFSRRRGLKSTMDQLKVFLKNAVNGADYHMAICLNDSQKHIGNISLNSIDHINRSAELSIMLGDRNEWGKGFAQEAVTAATQFAFENLKLHRLWAESPNPAFNKLIENCGWTREGLRREAFQINGQFINLECWSRLNHE